MCMFIMISHIHGDHEGQQRLYRQFHTLNLLLYLKMVTLTPY